MLDYDTQKDEMEIDNEDLFSIRDKMVKKSSNIESRSQQWLQGRQRCEQRHMDAGCKSPNKMERNGKRSHEEQVRKVLGRCTSESGQLVFTSVHKRTITIAASDDIVSDAIRVAADI